MWRHRFIVNASVTRSEVPSHRFISVHTFKTYKLAPESKTSDKWRGILKMVCFAWWWQWFCILLHFLVVSRRPLYWIAWWIINTEELSTQVSTVRGKLTPHNYTSASHLIYYGNIRWLISPIQDCVFVVRIEEFLLSRCMGILSGLICEPLRITEYPNIQYNP